MGRRDGEGDARPGVTLRHLLLCAVLTGVLLRVATLWQGFVFWDAPYYIQMGRGLAGGDGLLLPWGDPFTPAHTGFMPGSSHHFSPLFPAYLGAWYSITGYSQTITRLAAVVLSIVCLLVVYLTTRDLMGNDRALVVTAVFSLDPVLLISTRDLMPEPQITILFVLTIWAIVRAIRDDRYMVVAALCAAGGYLTKASVGYLFIVAGGGGFAWRFYYLRWDVFRRRFYMMAIALFLGIVGAWSWRNIRLFGWPAWQTSPYLEDALGTAVREPGSFALALSVTVPFFIAIFLVYGGYWLPWIRRGLGRVREERTSAFWLAVALVFVITLWFSAALAVYEGSDLFAHSAIRLRYVVIAFPPLMWAVMDEVELLALDTSLGRGAVCRTLTEAVDTVRTLPARWRRMAAMAVLGCTAIVLMVMSTSYLVVGGLLAGGSVSLLFRDPPRVLVVMLATFLLVSAELATEDVRVPQVELASDLDDLLGPGQTVEVHGDEINVGYLYIGLGNLDFHLTSYSDDVDGDFIITIYLDLEYPGYHRVGVYDEVTSPGVVKRLSHGLLPGSSPESVPTLALWERD